MAIGFFGKLPSQGDFVSRRLPWQFTAAWDDWLQHGLSQAKSTIGAAWNAHYLSAPLWRFQLQPGAIGPQAWIGLWFASVDRVGRQFPLVLAEPLPIEHSARYALIEQDETFFKVEDAALRGLDPRLSLDAFDRSLDGLSLLGAASLAPAATARGAAAADPTREAGGPTTLRIAADADVQAALDAAERTGLPNSCFFSWGNEQHAALLYRCTGLPPASGFHAFIDGRWP